MNYLIDVNKHIIQLINLFPICHPVSNWKIIIKNNTDYVAATDGNNLFVNSHQWEQLNSSNKLFVLLHEWFHLILNHHLLAKFKNKDVFNIAADFVVNSIILSNFSQLNFPFGFYDSNFENKSVEYIYNNLIENVNLYGENCQLCVDLLNSEGQYQCIICNKSVSKPTILPKKINKYLALNILYYKSNLLFNDLIFVIENQYKKNREVILLSQKIQGSILGLEHIPDFYKNIIFNTTNSKNVIELKKFLKHALNYGMYEINPYKIDTKAYPIKIYKPTIEKFGLNKIVFILDVSGSMCDNKEEEFKFVHFYIKQFQKYCDNIMLITSDCKVREKIRIKHTNFNFLNKINLTGGATNFSEAFSQAVNYNPNLIVIYSDLKVDKLPKEPMISTIFLTRGDLQAPYGKTFKI